MKPAKITRYSQRNAASSDSGARRGTSTTLNLSSDHRRLVSKTKPVNLPTKKATPTSIPPSSVLNDALKRVRQGHRTASMDEDYEAYLLDIERDFYDTNAGGFDDDYVETNIDGEEGGVPVMPAEADVCGLDDQGSVVFLTGEDGQKGRNFASDNPLHTWLPHRQEYLDELLRYEGRGYWTASTCCPCCTSDDAEPVIRCEDCFGGELVCEGCAILRHHHSPFHRIKRWNGRYFTPSSLASLGLVIRLGPHAPGTECPTGQTVKDFTIIHTNGIHSTTIDICHCNSPETHPRVQLLRAGIYPATVLTPQSGATFEAMRLFHILSLQGKLTGYDFINSLERYTDNTGLYPPPARLPAFMTMARQWRHLKMAKRAGRGHDPRGIEATSNGELAVECPACPRPGINLPEGWDKVPERDQWMYQLVLAMDANFRLKNRLRSSTKTDPGLGTGWAYFVPDEEYKAHVLKYATQEEISTCSGFEALSNANQKNARGLRSTGVGAIVCARHTFWRPTGMGDLQKGERYCNMDFIFGSGTSGTRVLRILLSYDVICQWKIKFFLERISGLPLAIRPRFGPEAIKYAVPKFHLPPHEAKCQAPHSLNFKPGAAETDGEGIERNWAVTNGAAPSTKEMGSGARHDTLDDHCGFANWQKTVTLANLLERRLDNALVEAEDHIGIFEEFTQDLNGEHKDEVVEWRRSILEWESGDLSSDSPYDLDGEVVSLAMVTRRHADEEAEQVRERHNVIPGRSAFILEGIAIEDTQRELASRLKSKSNPTDTQATSFKDQQTHLLRRIQRFRNDQDTHMPRVISLIVPEDNPSGSSHTTRAPEAIQLYMPSNIAENMRPTYCDSELCKMEGDIRYACAIDALGELRRSLHLRVYINKLKIKNVTGQRPNTKARSMQETIEHEVATASNKYRQARRAYISLVGEEEGKRLRELKPADVTGLGDRALEERERREIEATRLRVRGGQDITAESQNEEETVATIGEGGPTSGESRRHISWLWFQGGLEMGDGALSREMNDGVRVEWLKSRARAQRWEEEVRLLRAEMERTLLTFSWMAEWWDARTDRTCEGAGAAGGLGADAQLGEGLLAYASEHADMYRGLRHAFETRWKLVYDASQLFLARKSILDES